MLEPYGPEKIPVLLYRTPYNKNGLRNDAEYFARRGYVVVAQDCRGRFGSEGDFYPFVNEGLDGYDTIEWAAAQPWSNGKVGTIGGSYLAWDQYHAAMYRPPHLAAMFAQVGGANFIEEFGHPGGAPNLGWPMWILGSAASSPPAMREPALAEPLREVSMNPRPWLELHPQKRGEIFRNLPVHAKIYQDMYDHEDFGDYWKQKGLYTAGYYKLIKDVPTFFLSGWYDYFGEGTLDNFAALARMHKTPKKLLMGPWPHGIGRSVCGDGDFGPSAAVDMQALALDWFDHWMKDDPFDVAPAEPVRLFRMEGRGGQWRTASSWPPAGVRPSKYYIQAGGFLSPQRPGDAAPSSFVYDPENPVPTAGGRYQGCVQNQAPLDARADILRFSTAPLAAPVEVTGKVRARLWISSDAVDTDFTAKLIDVHPDGYAMILTDGVIRTRYRSGHEKSVPMKPGTIYEVAIDLGSTSNLFARGHRIRLDVSSSNFPRIEPNPNTGEPAGRWTRRIKARNTVYHDSKRGSYVELPVQGAADERR
jgi:putative CocE/NonD family hydrolase